MFIVDMVQDSHPPLQQTLDTAFTSTAAPPKMIHNRPYPLQQSSASWFLGNIRKRCCELFGLMPNVQAVLQVLVRV